MPATRADEQAFYSIETILEYFADRIDSTANDEFAQKLTESKQVLVDYQETLKNRLWPKVNK